MPSTYNNRILYSNPSAGQCNWDVDVERNNRINASIIPPGLDGNYVKSGGVTSVGAGLSVDVTDVVVVVDGVTNIAIGSNYILQPPLSDPFEVNFIWVDVNGTVQVTQEEPNETMVMLAIVDTDATSVLRIIDGRQMQDAGIADALATRKNKITNGDMSVDQEHGYLLATRTAPFYPADEWMFDGVGSYSSQCVRGLDSKHILINVVAPPPPLTGTEFVTPFVHRFEGQNAISLNTANHTLTIDFSSTVAGQYTAALISGDSANSIVFAFTVSANIRETHTFQVPFNGSAVTSGDETAGLSLVVAANQGSGGANPLSFGTWGSGNIIQDSANAQWSQTLGAELRLYGAQLEEGEGFSGFEYKSYTDQLLSCQRYYIKTGVGVDIDCYPILPTDGSDTRAGRIQFPVTMRIVPDVEEEAIGWATAPAPSRFTGGVRYYGQSSGGHAYVRNIVADARFS